MKVFDELFKEAFKGAKEMSLFEEGFSDAVEGRPAMKHEDAYNNGYGVGYEMMEKKDANQRAI